jgi:hypothetical protein
MISTFWRLVPALALILLVGCESNPDGPRAPSFTPSKASADGQPVPGAAPRQPVTKNPREIVNPD